MLTPPRQLGMAGVSPVREDFKAQSSSLGKNTIIHSTHVCPGLRMRGHTSCGSVILAPVLRTEKPSPREGKWLVQGILTKVSLPRQNQDLWLLHYLIRFVFVLFRFVFRKRKK